MSLKHLDEEEVFNAMLDIMANRQAFYGIGDLKKTSKPTITSEDRAMIRSTDAETVIIKEASENPKKRSFQSIINFFTSKGK